MKLLKTGTAIAALALGATTAMAQDTPPWCGPDEATVALLDGFGSATAGARSPPPPAREEALKCPSIKGVEYADGQGNTQKAISDIRSMAARGVDAMVVFGDAGPAVLPAVTQVFKAGTIVVPYRVDIGGADGENYNKWIGASFVNDGENWGRWIKEILPDGGKLLFLSGPAGNSQGLDELTGLKNVLDDSYVFVNPEPFAVTNWDPALTQQVLTAEISKNPDIDVIVSDFGPSLVGALPAFEKFGTSIPALATSDGNSLGCFWHANKDANPDFKLFTVATGNDNARLAMRWAVGACHGRSGPRGRNLRGADVRKFGFGQPQRGAVPRRSARGRSICRPELPADDQTSVINQ